MTIFVFLLGLAVGLTLGGLLGVAVARLTGQGDPLLARLAELKTGEGITINISKDAYNVSAGGQEDPPGEVYPTDPSDESYRYN